MIALAVGDEGEPQTLEEAVGIVLDQFPKRCRCCGRVFGLGDERPLQWEALPVVGIGKVLDQRDCPCGSTLALALVDLSDESDRPTTAWSDAR